MKKEERPLSFNDADYHLDMRCDPLTTTDEMKRELDELERRRKQRMEDAKKAEEDAKKAENDIKIKQLNQAQDEPQKTADNEIDVNKHILNK